MIASPSHWRTCRYNLHNVYISEILFISFIGRCESTISAAKGSVARNNTSSFFSERERERNGHWTVGAASIHPDRRITRIIRRSRGNPCLMVGINCRHRTTPIRSRFASVAPRGRKSSTLNGSERCTRWKIKTISTLSFSKEKNWKKQSIPLRIEMVLQKQS